ncbi:MAG: hypothetical protein AAFX94_09970 [Myxococcota bacterium]
MTPVGNHTHGITGSTAKNSDNGGNGFVLLSGTTNTGSGGEHGHIMETLRVEGTSASDGSVSGATDQNSPDSLTSEAQTRHEPPHYSVLKLMRIK